MKNLVVTGTGRSGTGYVAEILRHAGVSCGHEAVFTPGTVLRGDVPDWTGYDAESSWLALPSLGAFRMRHGGAVVLVVRHPVETVRSFLDLGVFDRVDDYSEAIAKTTPVTMGEEDARSRALAHWVNWNYYSARFADEILRVEDLHPLAFAPYVAALGANPERLLAAFDEVPRDVNSKTESKTPVDPDAWRGARRVIRKTAAGLARQFGYDDELLDAMEEE